MLTNFISWERINYARTPAFQLWLIEGGSRHDSQEWARFRDKACLLYAGLLCAVDLIVPFSKHAHERPCRALPSVGGIVHGVLLGTQRLVGLIRGLLMTHPWFLLLITHWLLLVVMGASWQWLLTHLLLRPLRVLLQRGRKPVAKHASVAQVIARGSIGWSCPLIWLELLPLLL